MKRYEKIWIPEKREGFEFRDGDGDTPTLQKGSFIVLTVEELKEVWMAGFNRADPENDLPAPTFQSYLASKGIKL
jgi:hypothetical protein